MVLGIVIGIVAVLLIAYGTGLLNSGFFSRWKQKPHSEQGKD